MSAGTSTKLRVAGDQIQDRKILVFVVWHGWDLDQPAMNCHVAGPEGGTSLLHSKILIAAPRLGVFKQVEPVVSSPVVSSSSTATAGGGK